MNCFTGIGDNNKLNRCWPSWVLSSIGTWSWSQAEKGELSSSSSSSASSSLSSSMSCRTQLLALLTSVDWAYLVSLRSTGLFRRWLAHRRARRFGDHHATWRKRRWICRREKFVRWLLLLGFLIGTRLLHSCCLTIVQRDCQCRLKRFRSILLRLILLGMTIALRHGHTFPLARCRQHWIELRRWRRWLLLSISSKSGHGSWHLKRETKENQSCLLSSDREGFMIYSQPVYTNTDARAHAQWNGIIV